ncbi:hypothetical protein SLS58_007354 [Diplodia intermedia]|uniref:Uncharacterized protein n=1 Tax=Diplodia intermedia TaxID=856260 RepID=A0ABR3TL34_9PEZI
MSADSDADFVQWLAGDKWGFLVFVTVAPAADPAQPDRGQQLPERARSAVEKIRDYVAHYLESHDEPYDERLQELLAWTVVPLPGADEPAIRAAFRARLAALNDGREADDVQVGRMCLVVDDDVVESVGRGPALVDYQYALESNVFVKVLDVDHAPGTSQVVAAAGRRDVASVQIRYEGWIRSTPRALFGLYDYAMRSGWSYGRFFGGAEQIHDL